MALLRQEEKDKSQATEEVEKVVESTPMSMGDPVVIAALGSVAYSWYQFYVNRDVETGLFVGLWAPTLLSAASYLQEKDIVRKVKQGFSSF